jgi:hypothetical protein
MSACAEFCAAILDMMLDIGQSNILEAAIA